MPIPERYRRLWRRRLRRRPLLPFLLLATVAVNLAFCFTTIAQDNFYNDNLFLGGLIGGQIALLAIWATHQFRGALARGFIALLLIHIALHASIGLPIEQEDMIGPTAYTMVLSITALAALTASALRWTCVPRTNSLRPRRSARLRVSTLLWITLNVAFLIVFGQEGEWSMLLKFRTLLIWIAIEALPIVIVLPIALRVHSPYTRFMLLILAPGIVLLTAFLIMPRSLITYYATYAAFLGAWLYLAGDRGPTPESKLIEEPVEAPPASIDLRA